MDVISREYFSGGRNIAEDPDAKRELADLIIELQMVANAGGLVAYVPAVPGDWDGIPPTTIAGACDRIAAALKLHLIPA
jgi:hypothetical protein